MFRKTLVFSSLLLALSLVTAPVSAQTTASTTASQRAAAKVADVAAKIKCVAEAVSAREVAISAAFAKHGEAVAAAYSTRANELAGAYSNTTVAKVRVGVKVAWADFNKTKKAAANIWREAQRGAWSAFRSAVSACKAPTGVSDSSNSSSEPSVQ
ncbi:MAG: hypothetical protein AAB933_01425 [Patescibacteria group bacterium]